jgi:lipopolysaccharide export system permease protein
VSGIIDRYLLREVLRTFVGVTAVLMLILLGDQFARGLARAAADRIPREAVLKLMGLTSHRVPQPDGAGGILLRGHVDDGAALPRQRDGGPQRLRRRAGRLLRPLLWAAAVVASGLAMLSFDTVPWAARMSTEIRQEGQRQLQLTALEPGRFPQRVGGRLVFYARDRNAAGQLTGVFIQQRTEENVEVVTAARADQRVSLERDENYLVLYDGDSLHGPARQPGVPHGAIQSSTASRCRCRVAPIRRSSVARCPLSRCLAPAWRKTAPSCTGGSPRRHRC